MHPETDDEFDEHVKEYKETEEVAPASEEETGSEEAIESKEAEPEEKPEEKSEPETVPLGTFLDEKRVRKQSQQQFEQLSTEFKALKEEIAGLKPKEAELDPEQNPVEYLDRSVREVKESVEKIGERLDETAQETRAGNFQTHVADLETTFARDHEDYFKAVDFLKASRMAEYQTMGMDNDAAEAVFNDEAVFLLQSAIKAGKNPAEVAYSLAKSRGFSVGDGGSADVESNAEKSLKSIAKRQETAQTLSGKGGKAVKDELELPDVNQLDDDEFDKLFLGKAGDRRLKKLMQ